MSSEDVRTWTVTALIVVVSLVLVIAGFALGITYCEYRRVSEFNQMAVIASSVVKFGEQCVSSLNDVTKASIVTARLPVQRAYKQAAP